MLAGIIIIIIINSSIRIILIFLTTWRIKLLKMSLRLRFFPDLFSHKASKIMGNDNSLPRRQTSVS